MRRYRLPILTVLLVSLLALAAGPAAAAPRHEGSAFLAPGGFVARLLDLLTGGWAKAGMILDPSGTPATGDEGMILDPSGGTVTGDEGMGLDPDGATATGDAGMGLDPDGATTTGDAGMILDPNG